MINHRLIPLLMTFVTMQVELKFGEILTPLKVCEPISINYTPCREKFPKRIRVYKILFAFVTPTRSHIPRALKMLRAIIGKAYNKQKIN
jgi:hypothetical protein